MPVEGVCPGCGSEVSPDCCIRTDSAPFCSLGCMLSSIGKLIEFDTIEIVSDGSQAGFLSALDLDPEKAQAYARALREINFG